MKIGHIELFVRDPMKSRQFYEEVLGFTVTAVQGEGQFVWLQLGQQEILLRPGQNHQQTPSYEQASTGIVLYTDNFEKTTSELVARGLVFKGTDGANHCYTFTDLDGNWFQLVDPGSH
jgi:catechol 2,3-dioxygenase-like lactoylglutathione lyase family enzyme